MKLSELKPGDQFYTQLDATVLAVLCRREDGWCVYVRAVPGMNHDVEWQEVTKSGGKLPREVAEAVARTLFHPGFEVDLPYAY